jgi:hypothetical protein
LPAAAQPLRREFPSRGCFEAQSRRFPGSCRGWRQETTFIWHAGIDRVLCSAVPASRNDERCAGQAQAQRKEKMKGRACSDVTGFVWVAAII